MASDAARTVTDDGPNAGCADGFLRVGDVTLASRLIVGTGKYATHAEMARCLAAAGADCVTVAVRRERLAIDHDRDPARGGRHRTFAPPPRGFAISSGMSSDMPGVPAIWPLHGMP